MWWLLLIVSAGSPCLLSKWHVGQSLWLCKTPGGHDTSIAWEYYRWCCRTAHQQNHLPQV